MRELTFARSLVLVLVLGSSFTVATVAAASVATVFVTNSNNSGPGSFATRLIRPTATRRSPACYSSNA